ncbi:thioredoxin family protein [Thiomonas bhubaneswarensis]|uniref:Thioredoxin n=1 Tax=Thiomonas bhubaneswarensis TaxID=339866 RepID=A0A0K6HY33_9BURK|nr:thioredoxin family protein [Thiomonas bhubaneswarensis]CUA95713.1 Thioredoxin [Thiomonas bhubaneswarensis]
MEPLLVACLCAQWCGVCRDWRAGFELLAAQRPQARFIWVDVEEAADLLGDYEPENFPVLAVQRGGELLYCAAVAQQPGLWLRLIDELARPGAVASPASGPREGAARLPDLRQWAR